MEKRMRLWRRSPKFHITIAICFCSTLSLYAVCMTMATNATYYHEYKTNNDIRSLFFLSSDSSFFFFILFHLPIQRHFNIGNPYNLLEYYVYHFEILNNFCMQSSHFYIKWFSTFYRTLFLFLIIGRSYSSDKKNWNCSLTKIFWTCVFSLSFGKLNAEHYIQIE